MPAAAPFDRDAVLNALPATVRSAIEEAAAILGLGAEWHASSTLSRFGLDVAFANLSRRLQAEEGASERRADIAAGLLLGLGDEAIESRSIRRKIQRARRLTGDTLPPHVAAG